jgi:NAD(P)H-hydrate epimerase
VAAFETEVMTECLPANSAGSIARAGAATALRLLKDKDAAGIGPGLTTDTETIEVVHSIIQQSTVPLVIDADAINAFQGSLEELANEKGQPLILTPHPGEFSRLTGVGTREILSNQIEISREFCQSRLVWLVLKTFRPLVVVPDGSVFVSPMGNPGMATAGMGDVLTGVLTSLVGQFAAVSKSDPASITRALCLGVFLHGLAGDLAAQEMGWEALIAGDVIDSLAEAYQMLEEE